MSEPTRLPIVDVKLYSDKALDVSFVNKQAEVSIDNIKIIQKSNIPYYEGNYEVDPSFETQTLETKEKKNERRCNSKSNLR